MTDHYQTLGVPRDATPDQIRKAHRDQAKALHPDKSKGDTAPFLALQKAYEVLRDPFRRRRYDETGDDQAFDARKFLTSLFIQAANALVERNYDCDLIEAVRNQLVERQRNAQAKAVRLRTEALRYKHLSTKVSVVDGGENPLAASLASQAVEKERQAVALEADALIGDLLLEELARYRFEVEQKAPPQTRIYGQAWVTFQ